MKASLAVQVSSKLGTTGCIKISCTIDLVNRCTVKRNQQKSQYILMSKNGSDSDSVISVIDVDDNEEISDAFLEFWNRSKRTMWNLILS